MAELNFRNEAAYNIAACLTDREIRALAKACYSDPVTQSIDTGAKAFENITDSEFASVISRLLVRSGYLVHEDVATFLGTTE